MPCVFEAHVRIYFKVGKSALCKLWRSNWISNRLGMHWRNAHCIQSEDQESAIPHKLVFFVVFSQKSAFLVLERAHMAFSIEMTSTNSKLCIQWNFKEMERNFIQLEFHLGKILSISMTNLYGLHTMEYSISSIGRKLASLKDFNKALISLQHRIFASLWMVYKLKKHQCYVSKLQGKFNCL